MYRVDFRVGRDRKQEYQLNFVILSSGEIMTAWNRVGQKKWKKEDAHGNRVADLGTRRK